MDRDRMKAEVLKRMRKDAPVYKGYVARGGALVPWYEADTAYDGSIKQQPPTPAEIKAFRALHADLPRVRTRTPSERLKEMTDTLVRTGFRHGDGTWSFPRSVMRDIQHLTGQMGEVVSEDVIQTYAAALLEEAEKRNKRTRPEVSLAQS